jgi:hypothetical protein
MLDLQAEQHVVCNPTKQACYQANQRYQHDILPNYRKGAYGQRESTSMRQFIVKDRHQAVAGNEYGETKDEVDPLIAILNICRLQLVLDENVMEPDGEPDPNCKGTQVKDGLKHRPCICLRGLHPKSEHIGIIWCITGRGLSLFGILAEWLRRVT